MVLSTVFVLLVMVVVLLVLREIRGQGVVAFEGVRPDDQIAYAGIVRQFHRQRGMLALGAALLFENLSYGVMVRDALLDGLADRRFQASRSELIQQTQQAGRGATVLLRRDSRAPSRGYE